MSNKNKVIRPIVWAYGVTTVPERKDNLLVETLHSLCDAGFGYPQLFVDGCNDPSEYRELGGLVSCRPKPPVKIVGNWMMGMWELYVRNPLAHRYVMFQDDIQAVSDLREYLESCPYPKKGYLNLYTHEENTRWTHDKPGWCIGFQKGLGALGLVFDREALQTVLINGLLVRKPASVKRSWKSLDGGVSQAMKNSGYKEYIHNPSLLQHWGTKSTLGNRHYPPVEGFFRKDVDS